MGRGSTDIFEAFVGVFRSYYYGIPAPGDKIVIEIASIRNSDMSWRNRSCCDNNRSNRELFRMAEAIEGFSDEAAFSAYCLELWATKKT